MRTTLDKFALAGGGALLRCLAKMLSEEIGIPVCVADEPLLSGVRDAGMVLEDLGGYKNMFINF